MSSLGQATVCKIEKIENHPNADKLDLVHFDGVTVCSQKGLYNEGQLVIYVPPDMYKKTEHEALSFADRHIKAKKLRGVVSYGLILPNIFNSAIGDNVTDQLGLVRYEDWKAETEHPTFFKTTVGKSPRGEVKYTDIESLKKYHNLFKESEPVIITEKVHGQNARFVYQDGRLYVGSRTRWIEPDDSTWWQTARKYNLEEILKDWPDHILFGEEFGYVQDIRYGHEKGNFSFLAFDVYNINTGKYLDYVDFLVFCVNTRLQYVPQRYIGGYQGLDHCKSLGEMDSQLYNGLSEGIVIRPLKERWEHRVGRLILKYHSSRFLLR